MKHDMSEHQAHFQIGQVVEHKLFGYLGVIFDVDPEFSSSDEWYEQVARSRPPKDKPWYHVLVDGSAHTTYVAQQNLDSTDTPHPIHHPLTDHFFTTFDGERYTLRGLAN